MFFVFLDKMMVKEVWKTKKTQSFFLVFHCAAKKKLKPQTPKNKKNLSFFVSHTSLTIILSKKKKKPWVCFSFFKVKTKKSQKKTRQNQQKPNMSLRPNILWKVLVFWFFGFLEVFLILSIELSQRVSKYCFLLVFSTFFVFLGFPHGFSPKESSNIVFLFPTCFDSVHSYYPQDIFKK